MAGDLSFLFYFTLTQAQLGSYTFHSLRSSSNLFTTLHLQLYSFISTNLISSISTSSSLYSFHILQLHSRCLEVIRSGTSPLSETFASPSFSATLRLKSPVTTGLVSTASWVNLDTTSPRMQSRKLTSNLPAQNLSYRLCSPKSLT